MRLPVLDKLENELMESKRELEVDIPKALKTATDMGDLSENAEYKAAKERQMFLQSRISQLQGRISNVMQLDVARLPKDRAGLGSKLHLKNLDTNEDKIYHLVFPEEVDPDTGRISPASPIGKSLVGKKEGDEVTMKFGGNEFFYEVTLLVTIHEMSAE